MYTDEHTDIYTHTNTHIYKIYTYIHTYKYINTHIYIYAYNIHTKRPYKT